MESKSNNIKANRGNVKDRYKKLKMLYAYEFSDNSVYVGLTDNANRRRQEHLSKKKIKESAVALHIEKTKLQPKYVELTGYIDPFLAKDKERDFEIEYQNKNWTILNRAPTGGLGGNEFRWTIEMCKESSQQYKTRSDWYKNDKEAYSTATHRGWLEECTKHMEYKVIQKKKNYWNVTTLTDNAKNYRSVIEWRIHSPAAFQAASRLKLLDECYAAIQPTNIPIEKILCAAIWFVNGKKYPYQPKNIDEGIVLCGHRHGCIFQQWQFFNTETQYLNVAGRHAIDVHEKEQGFLTNHNRFVSREEGAEIAFTAGQIKEKKQTLYSEDLY